MIVAIGGQEILVTLIERLDLHTEGRVLLLDILEHHILDGIDKLAALVLDHLIESEAVEISRDVFLLNHEAHEELFIRQFFLVAVGHEAIQHVVVLYGRVTTDSLEAAMVIGKHESVRRYNDTRAIASE